MGICRAGAAEHAHEDRGDGRDDARPIGPSARGQRGDVGDDAAQIQGAYDTAQDGEVDQIFHGHAGDHAEKTGLGLAEKFSQQQVKVERGVGHNTGEQVAMEIIKKKGEHQAGQNGPGVAIDLTEKQEGQTEGHDQVPGFRHHGPIDDDIKEDDLIKIRPDDQEGP